MTVGTSFCRWVTEVPKLPAGTSVWAIDVDGQGRIARVDAGMVLDIGAAATLHESTSAINRVRASAETTTVFWYANVAEVSEQPKG